MTLEASATVTLDRLRYTVQIRSVTAGLSLLPGVDEAQVVIAAGVEVAAGPGSDASVTLDGGDGAAAVIEGEVARVERSATGTLVSVTDAGAALAAVRPHKTYSGMPAAQIIGELARMAGVSSGPIVASTQTAAYVADPRRTGAEHVAALAARAGALAAIDASGRLTVMPWPIGVPSVAMRRDREFLALETSTHRPGHAFALVGAGGAGVAAAPDAWLVDTDALTNADDPGPSTSRWSDPVLRTTADVDRADEAAATRRVADQRRLRGECWLQPARRPGDVVRIQQTAQADQAGPWLLTSVRHELGWGRSRTVLTGVSAAGSGGMAGALAGMVGGLS